MVLIPDAQVNGFISDGETSINFSTIVACIGGDPVASLSGNINNVFTGGPELNNFTFSSNSAILLGVEPGLKLIHVLYDGVEVKNTTTNETFSNGTAVLTAERITSDTWKGSISILFGGHSLTFFGTFAGEASPNRQALCQLQL